MSGYFKLQGSNAGDAAKFAHLNDIAQPYEGYSWGSDIERGLLWFTGPQPPTHFYSEAIERWRRDLNAVGLSLDRFSSVDPSE